VKVLGINFSYDSSAALVIDGEVIAAVQEERFRRIKHFAGFPTMAIDWCLKTGGLRLEDLDAVAFFWNPSIHAFTHSWRLSQTPRHHLEFMYDVANHLLPNIGYAPEVMEEVFYLKGGKKLRLFFVTHHLAHAAGAFFSSPFEHSAIITVDGYGERDCTVIWKADGQKIERVWTKEFPQSLGSYYAAFTQFLGFKPNSGEGKVMGLASYGEKTYVDEIAKMLQVSKDDYTLDLSYFSFYLERPVRYTDKLVEALGPPRIPESLIEKRHEDIAHSMQAVFEKAILMLGALAKRLTGEENLCMSGGVTLNCSANGELIRSGLFKDYYFQPPASDAGSALGAALFVEHCIFGTARRGARLLLDYLGPSFSNDEIRKALEKGGIKYFTPSDKAQVVGKLLAQGLVGSLFQGRAEFGPRALGNRSTLADPRPAHMKDYLNAKVKFREPFRPYAPSVLIEYAPLYFEGCVSSPFMLRVYPTKKEKLAEAGAVTHVDGGARVQTVSREQNPFYYDVIEAFFKETGTPLVLNTSFNIRGEPIVNSPEDAIKCYLTTGMDFLLIGDFLLIKDLSKL
jgi:carbamoyltransferase